MMREIPLTRGMVALVDDEDFPRVSLLKWYAHRCSRSRCGAYYAQHSMHGGDGAKTLCLHRFVMNAAPGVRVDHKNRNTLDCRKGNLRVASNGENIANAGKHSPKSSRFKGVTLHRGRWCARIRKDKRLIVLGTFSSEIVAARAYDEAAVRIHGEFASTNVSLGLLDEVAS